MAEIRHFENRHDVIFGGPIWIKFRRLDWLVQNYVSTAVLWSISKPDVEFQYGGRLGEYHGMSSQSHVSHCRVLPLGEFTVMFSEPYATFQGAVIWRNQCHDRATLQGVKIPPAILKIAFRHIIFFIVFLNAVWALTSSGFRIVSNTLVSHGRHTDGGFNLNGFLGGLWTDPWMWLFIIETPKGTSLRYLPPNLPTTS